MPASRFLTPAAAAAAASVRGHRAPPHASTHLWIPDSLVSDVFRAFCLRWMHARNHRRPSTHPNRRHPLRPLRFRRTRSTPSDKPPHRKQASWETEGLFSWTGTLRDHDSTSRASQQQYPFPKKSRLARSTEESNQFSLVNTFGEFRQRLAHLIQFGAFGPTLTTSENKRMAESDRRALEEIRTILLEAAPIYNRTLNPKIQEGQGGPAGDTEAQKRDGNDGVVLDPPRELADGKDKTPGSLDINRPAPETLDPNLEIQGSTSGVKRSPLEVRESALAPHSTDLHVGDTGLKTQAPVIEIQDWISETQKLFLNLAPPAPEPRDTTAEIVESNPEVLETNTDTSESNPALEQNPTLRPNQETKEIGPVPGPDLESPRTNMAASEPSTDIPNPYLNTLQCAPDTVEINIEASEPNTALGSDLKAQGHIADATEPNAEARECTPETPESILQSHHSDAEVLNAEVDTAAITAPVAPISPPIPIVAPASVKEALDGVSFGEIESPNWSEKIVLGERIQMTPLPELSKVGTKLHKMILDKSIPVKTILLVYCQVDALLGVQGYTAPANLIWDLANRIGGTGREWVLWLLQHREPNILKKSEHELLPKRLSEELARFRTRLDTLRSGYRGDSLGNRISSLDRMWNSLKRSAAITRNPLLRSEDFCIRVLQTEMILDDAINAIEHGEWSPEIQHAAEICIDIFLFYRERSKTLCFLFRRAVKFLQVWMRHWDSRRYSSHLRSGTGPDAAFWRPSVRQYLQAAYPKQEPKNAFGKTITGLSTFLEALPPAYTDRLLSVLLLYPARQVDNFTAAAEPWTKSWTRERLLPLTPWCRPPAKLPRYCDRTHLSFLRNPWAAYEAIMVTQNHATIAQYLQGRSDLEIIGFHLRTWTAHHGVRYFNNKKMLGTIQHVMECIDRRLQRIPTDDNDPKSAGRLYAQAILSLFYLELPTELFATDLLRTLSRTSTSTSDSAKLLSCIAILKRFTGKIKGDITFRMPKYAIKLTLQNLRRTNPYEALRLLSDYHNRNTNIYGGILLETADQHPNETHFVLHRFMDPLLVRSEFNPQISFTKRRGRPQRKFLVQLAMRYALSKQHSANVATRRISFIRMLMNHFRYGADIRVARALVAAAMIRSVRHRLWTGEPVQDPRELFRHHRLLYAVARFEQDAARDPMWRKGVRGSDVEGLKRGFLEMCAIEVWKEVGVWRKQQDAVLAARGDMSSTAI